MKASASIEINSSKEEVWQMVTDYSHWQEFVSAIQKVEILEKPSDGIKGLKWKETRTMFGKEAEETMWVTESEVNSYYKTKAESHGSIYLSLVKIEEKGEACILTQGFEGLPQSFLGKLMMGVMGGMMKKSTEKALYADLTDMKNYIEKNNK